MTTANKINQACLVILTTIAVASVLTYTKPVLVPFVFAIFTYAMFSPIIYWIQVHLKLHRILAITLALLCVVGVGVGIVFILAPAVKQLIYGINDYDSYLANILISIEQQLPNVHIDKEFITEQARQFNPLAYVKNLTGHTLIFLGNLVLILIYTGFMIAGNKTNELKSPMIRKILLKIFEYTVKKLILALAAGLVFMIVLGSFRVDLALIFALAAVLLNFIPTLGPIAAVILPLPVVFYMYGLGTSFFVIFGVLSVMQFIIGNVIEPYVLGEIMDLHPITVMICLVFWGLIWGVSGMFLAVPITSVIKIIFERIETTRPVAELLAGRLPR